MIIVKKKLDQISSDKLRLLTKSRLTCEKANLKASYFTLALILRLTNKRFYFFVQCLKTFPQSISRSNFDIFIRNAKGIF